MQVICTAPDTFTLIRNGQRVDRISFSTLMELIHEMSYEMLRVSYQS